MKQLTLIAFVCIACMYVSVAQPGTLDSSFGQNGKVITSFNNDVSICYGSATQKDGKIIVVGGGNIDNGQGGFLAVRYTIEGQLDATFGVGGRVLVTFEEGSGEARDVAIQNDGKIVIVGYGGTTKTTPNDIFLVRLNSNGLVDSTFGLNGRVITDFNNYENARAIAIQSDGKIIVAGNFEQQKFLIVRYLSNGVIDNTFGENGKVIAPWGGLAFANDVLVQPDGKIITCGSSGGIAVIARYFPNGIPDSAFGTNGVISNSFGFASTSFKNVSLDKSASIIAAGSAGDGIGNNMLLVKYNLIGKLDSSFGVGGKTVITFNEGFSRVSAIGLQKDGKIVAMGDVYNPFNGKKNNFAVARVVSDGTIDESFDLDGKVITDFGSDYWEYAVDGFLTAEEKVVVVGNSGNYDSPVGYAILLARYNGDAPEKNKYLRIKHWLHHHGITWEDKPNNLINYYSIQSSTNGNAFTEVARIFSNHNGGIQTYTAANNATANYRVAAISNTGNITYSNTLTLTATPTIQLYPNPAKNNLQIKGLPAGTTKLTVTDIRGNTSIIATTNSTVYNINIAQLTSGNYLLHIKTANEVITKQFIKE
ncbi:T9SS type A sorting domain-containing protein [Limnovirga soli]|uniref:T9SS type A sorting domain-containing protein n=1 Tax=Limnovirga soli TaxID=2656915 RepID=A0A8J8FG54_9BACT|nr:T9SS type A sorting domain-containing protein [Limnovirga soli]NNV57010.1 T9SS type A sorting domain-containing protein [Limnovirga soli]